MAHDIRKFINLLENGTLTEAYEDRISGLAQQTIDWSRGCLIDANTLKTFIHQA
jgi:hypothetical protein